MTASKKKMQRSLSVT